MTGLFVDPNERALREAAALGRLEGEGAGGGGEGGGDGGGGGGGRRDGDGSRTDAADAAALRRGLEPARLELLERADWVRYSLAGNLADFACPSADGRVLAGRALRYHGNQPLCYGRHPCEHVAFVGCHDNETVFDQVATRLPLRASADDRARACRLAASLSLLSIGVPFLHAGDDLLRSKSLDRDSYDSGDWFNAVDWTGALGNGFGRGLPPAAKNAGAWPAKRRLLRDAARVAPTPAMRRRAASYVRALLRARYSSPLFRMADAAHVCAQLRFLNTGPEQMPGAIVMVLSSAPVPTGGAGGGEGGGTHDGRYASVVCVFNARPEPYEFSFPGDNEQGGGGGEQGGGGKGGSGALALHPALEDLRGLQGDDRDEAVEGCYAEGRRLVVAARTAAVFVEEWAR